MAEGQVSVEGRRHGLSNLFFVIATQNPVEFRGTYPLPEAQMDRFMMRFGLGYVAAPEEVAILKSQRQGHPIDAIQPCASADDVAPARCRPRGAHQRRIDARDRRPRAGTRELPGVQRRQSAVASWP
jgi:MoxR-like ATPase